MDIKSYEESLKNEFQSLLGKDKFIILGTGSLFIKMKRFFNIDIKNDVECFVESFPKEKSFQGKKVISTDELRSKWNKSNKLVLVCSSAWPEIKKNMSEDLLINLNWYAPYESNGWLFDKDNLPIVQLEKNIRNLLINYEGSVPEIDKESILIMVSERTGNSHPYHAITLGVLLRLKGLNVRFLFNDLSNFGDLYRGKGFVEFQNQILKNLLDLVSDKYGIRYEKMSDQVAENLTDRELKKINQFIYYNKIWHSKKITFSSEDSELNERASRWLSNARLIKGFLNKHHFEKVYVWTGVHSEWSALRILSEEKDIKIYSSEYARKGYSFSLSGPTVFQKDSTLVKLEQLNNEQINKLVNFTNKHMKEKLKNIQKNNGQELNVLIPLNIFWDSAAFNIKDVFVYFDQWLIKTVRFLIEECKAHVYVRQHPHERNYGTGDDVKALLDESFGNSALFHFIDAISSIDTYSLIDNAQLILPNTSTVGVEASIMGKQVIVKNEVYYANLSFVKKACTEEEYFHFIKEALFNPKELSSEQINDAKLCYALTMTNSVDTFFGHWYDDVNKWSLLNLEEIKNYKSVQWLLDTIVYDKSLLSNKLRV